MTKLHSCFQSSVCNGFFFAPICSFNELILIAESQSGSAYFWAVRIGRFKRKLSSVLWAGSGFLASYHDCIQYEDIKHV